MTVVLATASRLQSTSTAIKLREGHRVGERANGTVRDSITLTTAEDDVMQASLVADVCVPDGGEGWVVVFGCAVVTWWFTGTSYCWGVLQAALVKVGLSTASTLAFVGSLAAACISFMGIVNAKLVRKLGTRASALMGIFLLGLGEVLSGFAVKNVAGLFATAGVVMGIGIRYLLDTLIWPPFS